MLEQNSMDRSEEDKRIGRTRTVDMAFGLFSFLDWIVVLFWLELGPAQPTQTPDQARAECQRY